MATALPPHSLLLILFTIPILKMDFFVGHCWNTEKDAAIFFKPGACCNF